MEAGLALLRRRGLPTGPVAYDPVHARVQLLVPSGSAEELPGLLEWLDRGGNALGLSARSYDPREAAVWLRPPVPERAEGTAGTAADGTGPMSLGGPVDGVDLVRLVSAAATECHRTRLGLQPGQPFQPLAFS